MAADELGVVPPASAGDFAEHAAEVLAAFPDLLLHFSADGRFLGYQTPALAPFVEPPGGLIGRHVSEVLPPDVAGPMLEAMRVSRLNNIHQHVEYSLTLGPEARDFEARMSPLPSGGFLAVVREITDSLVAEKELVSAREDALERSRLKSLFLANVSHEIRTPLNGILGVTQLLKQQALPADLAEYVDVLQSAGESLHAIVNDVLDLSRIEANRLELESRVFDLAQVVHDSTRSFFAAVQKKGIELTVELSDDARGPVRGDHSRVRQLVNNLVGNAVKFTEKGFVRVTVARDSELVNLRVTDTGPGIAAEHLERIFEPFEQENTGVQRRFGGTGLGLAITRRLARLMGGEVTVKSTPGEGSTFELSVPLPLAVTARPAPLPRNPGATRSLRVLLAEDDEVNAAMTAEMLRRLGHEVCVVGNGQAAIDAALTGAYGLVFMDVQLPGLDGLSATRAIRDYEKTAGDAHLPIVAVTASAMKGDDLRCLSAGMDAYLPKPVSVGALKDLLTWFAGG